MMRRLQARRNPVERGPVVAIAIGRAIDSAGVDSRVNPRAARGWTRRLDVRESVQRRLGAPVVAR